MDLLPLPAEAPQHLLLGFSGGRDSTALLHRLAESCADGGRRLRAVHVHHGLHPDADAWADHCQAQAAALGIECVVRRVEVRPDGRGLEDAARRARYAAFAEERRKDECLVLAHHRDDQSETVLLALLRGSGERGLSAMRPFSHDARGPLWRPLLDTPAKVVEAFAKSWGLAWVEDPSNDDLRLSRNRLRHEVMPLLRRHWPQADAALARSAASLAAADALLETEARRDLAALQGLSGDTLILDGLHALPTERAVRVLRCWTAEAGAPITRDAIGRVLGEWRRQPRSRALRHALGPCTLRQWDGRLWLSPTAPPHAAPTPVAGHTLPWEGRDPLPLPHGGCLLLLGAPRLDAPLMLHPRPQAPRRFRAAGDHHSRPLQSVFAVLGVPPWQRDGVPLLVDGLGELQALGDLAYGAELGEWLQARGARLLWQPAPVAG